MADEKRPYDESNPGDPGQSRSSRPSRDSNPANPSQQPPSAQGFNPSGTGGQPGSYPPHASTHGSYVPPPYDDEDEIDLLELVRTVWEGRKAIYWSVGVFVAIGLFVALGTPESFTSEVKLIPEARGGSGFQLGGLARQFGIGGSSQQTDGIPVNLYPDVTSSVPLMQQLKRHPVYVPRKDTTVALSVYLSEMGHPNPVGTVSKYTIRLPLTMLSTVLGWFRSEEPETIPVPATLDGDGSPPRIIRMSRDDWELVRGLRDRINTSYNERSGVIQVRVEMPDAEVAAEVAHQVVLFMNEYIIDYRTEKAQRDLEFIEEMHREARQRFEQAQEKMAEFTDRHRGTLTAVAQIEQQRLQSEYNLAFSLYNNMSERLEEARIKLQEETPVVKVIEPAAVPDTRSSPRRARMMIISVMLGGMAGVGFIFGKKMIHSLRERWRGNTLPTLS